MVVGVGGLPVGSERPVPDAGRARRAPGTRRRDVLRGLFGAGAVAAIAPVVAASRPPRAGGGDGPGASGFDLTYRGRHLVGAPVARSVAAGDEQWRVTVDGRPLHLMRRADGSWLSMVDHYRSYDTPLDAARAAVDELGPGEHLRDPGPGTAHEHTDMGGRHGLHP
ncbi:tyrosinase family oxidase copper chaperone [Streptomyces longwoodensis]|uniref:tyrosinase family oxidase copper chaperone n=1 Tax=Streptomyces longwoodensis TaxID=68231 RepID=UPI0033A0898B